MRRIVWLISIVAWNGCSGGGKGLKEFNGLNVLPPTTVTYGQSQQIDLLQATCLIHYLDRKDTLVHFTLTEADRMFLLNLLNSMQVDSSKNETQSYLGGCTIMPKVLTTIVIQFSNSANKLVIDGSCQKFERKYRERVSAIKNYLRGLDEILKMKSEILNAPKSNVIYL